MNSLVVQDGTDLVDIGQCAQALSSRLDRDGAQCIWLLVKAATSVFIKHTFDVRQGALGERSTLFDKLFPLFSGRSGTCVRAFGRVVAVWFSGTQ